MHVLSDEQLRRTAPSIFAVAPCASVSDRYGFVPTIDVVNALRTAGWWPVHAAQTEVRKPENRNVTRHVVRFWRQEQPLQVGDTLAQLVLTNSHDRTVTYGLDVGLYRLACLNGLVVDCRELDSLRIRHGSRIVDEVIDASQEVIKRVPAVLEAVNRFQQIRLARHERERYATWALEARYGVDWQRASPITQAHLLTPRRAADASDDLWCTYNTVQENLFRGGLQGRSASGRRVSTRGIRSVRRDIGLNKTLWRLAERMADRQAA
jgi:hypothetical protein